uniref:Uncharacterized protein n=1 Tax=Neogobius melanostomus TaxID=47308 RepID=A0A8C6SD22_9GOBI
MEMDTSQSTHLAFGTSPDKNKLREARMLLSGMDYSRITEQDEDGDTILHIYTAKGLRECAIAAAERLRSLWTLDAKEHKGKTALLVAVTANLPDIVCDLLSLGADINTCDVNGQTALHLAAHYGYNLVLQSDCSLSSRATEKLACVQLLLSKGSSLLSQEIKSNNTVLHLAVKEGNIDLVRFLLKIPQDNMKAHGHTALHMAAGLHGNPYQKEMVQLLLLRGADPSIRSLENDQAAHLLQSGPVGEQLKALLKRRNASSRRRIFSLQDNE